MSTGTFSRPSERLSEFRELSLARRRMTASSFITIARLPQLQGTTGRTLFLFLLAMSAALVRGTTRPRLTPPMAGPCSGHFLGSDHSIGAASRSCSVSALPRGWLYKIRQSKPAMSVVGTSRHFVALRNLVAMAGIADIDQARFMSARPNAVGTTANAGHRPLADSYQPTFDASTTTLVLIPTRS